MNAATKTKIQSSVHRLGGAFPKLLPGFAASILVALAAFGLAGLSGLPVMLLALFCGLAAQPLLQGEQFAAGLTFSAKKLLRVGVGLLGAGVVASEIAALGWSVLALCVLGVVFTIAVGCITARFARSDMASGLLFGGAVAICGASAALAISAALPQTRENEAKTVLAVIGVTALSTLAMVVYPLITAQLGFTDKAAGIFFGAAIHDVAQVVGAGYMVSDVAGETATMVKLVRVACLVPVVAVIAVCMRRSSANAAHLTDEPRIPIVPLFLLGFIALSVVASSGLVPAPVLGGIADLGKALLVLAIAALGCQTALQCLYKIGLAPVMMLVVPTIALAVLVLFTLIGLPALF